MTGAVALTSPGKLTGASPTSSASGVGDEVFSGQLRDDRHRALRRRERRVEQLRQPDHGRRAVVPAGDHAAPGRDQPRDPGRARDRPLPRGAARRPRPRAGVGAGRRRRRRDAARRPRAQRPVRVDRRRLRPRRDPDPAVRGAGAAVELDRVAQPRRRPVPRQDRHADRQPARGRGGGGARRRAGGRGRRRAGDARRVARPRATRRREAIAARWPRDAPAAAARGAVLVGPQVERGRVRATAATDRAAGIIALGAPDLPAAVAGRRRGRRAGSAGRSSTPATAALARARACASCSSRRSRRRRPPGASTTRPTRRSPAGMRAARPRGAWPTSCARRPARRCARSPRPASPVKVISGDDPETVVALARQAGLADDRRRSPGPSSTTSTTRRSASWPPRPTVFGRITPAQKERLVGALRDRRPLRGDDRRRRERRPVAQEGQPRDRDGQRQPGDPRRRRPRADAGLVRAPSPRPSRRASGSSTGCRTSSSCS